MNKNIDRPASDAEWYCRRDPEEERFYEFFFQSLPEIRRTLGQRHTQRSRHSLKR